MGYKKKLLKCRFLWKIALCLAAFVYGNKPALAQKETKAYIETVDRKDGRNEPMLIGKIGLSNIQNNPNYKWFDARIDTTKIDLEAAEKLQKTLAKHHLLVFLGTWCGDTQALLPQLYSYVFKNKISPEKISLIAVDRNKRALGRIAQKYKITRVPTFILLDARGREKGRVEEYGKTGAIVKEIAIIPETP